MTGRRSFTLLEVLAALGLGVILLGAVFGYLYDLLSTRDRALDMAARQRAVIMLIERLESDLMTCIVGDAKVGAGVQGDETGVRVLTRGVPVSLAERGADDPAVFGDLQRAEYRFDARLGEIQARREPIGAGPGPATEFSGLGGWIAKVRFRYHDGSAWRESFDSLSAGRLPVAIEVGVWFDPWPEDLLAADMRPGETGDGTFAERLTFDELAGFDEEAVAATTDLEGLEEPEPDRVRVITIPDAAAGEATDDDVERLEP